MKQTKSEKIKKGSLWVFKRGVNGVFENPEGSLFFAS